MAVSGSSFLLKMEDAAFSMGAIFTCAGIGRLAHLLYILTMVGGAGSTAQGKGAFPPCPGVSRQNSRCTSTQPGVV